MATLATMYNRLFLRGFEQAAKVRSENTRNASGGTALRSFANEDIYFFVKRIDNTRVVREADPQARERLIEISGQRSVPVLLEDGKLSRVGWQGRACVI